MLNFIKRPLQKCLETTHKFLKPKIRRLRRRLLMLALRFLRIILFEIIEYLMGFMRLVESSLIMNRPAAAKLL